MKKPIELICSCAIFGLTALLAGEPFAQVAGLPNGWVYINSAGVKTFSDVAPPPATPEKNILSRPGSAMAARPATAASAETGASAAAAVGPAKPRISTKNTELESRLKADEAAKKASEAAEAKAEADKAAASKKLACAAAKSNQAALKSDNRIASINAKGEREFLNDQQRAERLQKSESTLADC